MNEPTQYFYMNIAWYIFLLTSTISLTIFLAHLAHMAILYIKDEHSYTFLSKRIEIFEMNDVEEFSVGIAACIGLLLLLVFLALTWPIYIIGFFGGTIYLMLRSIRYAIRRSRQFKAVAHVLHTHPAIIQKEEVYIPEVEF